MPKPQRFRRKVFEVEAMRYTEESKDQVLEWARGLDALIDPYGPKDLLLSGWSGVQRIKLGEWLIRGVDGEFYPCPHGVFEESYEPLTTPF